MATQVLNLRNAQPQPAADPTTKDSELDHISELAERYDLGMVSAAQAPLWRREMVDTAARAFDRGATSAEIAARGQGFFPENWQPHTPAGWDVIEA